MLHLCFAGDDGADVVEFVECRHRGKVVDVDVDDFIADLSEHRVVELEKRQLYACAFTGNCREVFADALLAVVAFKVGKYLVGAMHD